MDKLAARLKISGKNPIGRPRLSRSFIFLSFIFFVFYFGLIGEIYHQLGDENNRSAGHSIDRVVEALRTAIIDNNHDAVSSGLAVRGFFDTGVIITEEKFSHFVDILQLQNTSALYTIIYLQKVTNADLPIFEKEMMKTNPEFVVYPVYQGSEHYIVRYERTLKGTKAIIGYDAASEPSRLAVINSAIDTGQPVISGLIGSIEVPGKNIFYMAVPVYKNGSDTSTIELRRQNLGGIVIEPFIIDDFFNSLISGLNVAGGSLKIFDGPIGGNNLIFDSNKQQVTASAEKDIFRRTIQVKEFGREWNIYLSYLSTDVLTSMQLMAPNIVLVSGAVMGLFLLVIIVLLVTSGGRTYNLAREMTAEMEKFKLAVDNANSHIIITDPEGKIIYANASVERITGYSPAEVIGNNPRLWGGLMGKEFYQKMWHQIKEEKLSFRSEVKNKRKNGEVYATLMSISPILDEAKNLVGFVGLEDDISERVKAEEALRQQTLILAEEKSRDETLLASIGEGVVAVDETGRVILANKVAQELLALKAAEIIGRPYFELWTVSDGSGKLVPTEQRPVQIALEKGETVSAGNYSYSRKSGGTFPVYITVAPTFQDSKLSGAILVFRDITREKEIDRMKTEFISLASHQLRTPLSAMKWFLEILLTDEVAGLNEKQIESLRSIDESNERMIDLVNSLLNVSRIEAGRVKVEPVLSDMRVLIDGIVAQVKRLIDEKKQVLTVSLVPDLPEIMVDEGLLAQVFLNLLTNSNKYSPEEAKISIEVTREGDYIQTKISDNGYGIPLEEQDRVFGKFYRGGNVVKLETEGNGLGLYLAKLVVEEFGGKIWFKSEGENKGLTVWFTLPISGMKPKEGPVSLEKVRVG